LIINNLINKQTNRKLLLIDDDEPARLLIRDILETANVTILECGCGNEALNLFKKYAWELDLVLLDIRLPDCSGWELLRQFRQINPLVIFVAISATSPTELARRFKIGEIDAYISKPFDIGEFKKLITVFLR
jgi:DNA-binding response OmpR family regulator